MLISLYLKLHTKIQTTRYTFQGNHPSRLGILRLAKLFLLEWILLVVKYLLLVLKHPSESFKILVNQPALAVCPYSYTDHKSFQKKVRVFSLGGLTALIGATIISSLILNLSTGPIFQTKAATYTFNQTNWQGGQTSNNATHTSNQTNWNEYSAKDANLTTINSGADLQLSTTSSSTTQTSDTDWNTGALSNTAVSGTGDSADIVLSKVAHINEYTIGALTNLTPTASTVTDNSNGTWTIAFGATDLSRIFKNDKFKDSANKSWKILSSFDSADKIIVWDSEGNGGAPATGASTVGRWYGSISLWEAGREGNLVTRNAMERGLPYYDGAADTTAVTIDGWTTDAAHYVEIYVPLSERHRGVWDNNRYYMDFTNATAITINVSNVRIGGLQISIGGAIGGFWGIGSTVAISNIFISNNIIRTTGNAYDQGVNLTNNSNTDIKIWNNIIYLGNNSQNSNNSAIMVGNGTSYIYSNTTYSGFAGIYGGGSNTTAKNNIVQGTNANGGFYGTFSSASDYNISDLASDAPSPSYRSGLATTIPFIDATNKDFHLEFRDGTGNPARDAGADLSADANLAFTTDIDGDTRSGTWDIGADDVGATLVKVHSIGTASRNFSTLQNWESARDGTLTTRNVFKITAQSGAFTEGETITGTSGATGTYIKEQDTPGASETYMTVDKINGTAFVAGDTLTGGTSAKTATLSTILTTAGTIERGEASNDSTFTAGVTIDNSTTDATHYMWLTAAPSSRHTGVAGTGAKVQSEPTTVCATNAGIICILDNYTKLEWLEVIQDTATTYSASTISSTYLSNNYLILSNLIIRKGTGANGAYAGIMPADFPTGSVIRNSIISGFNNATVNTGGIYLNNDNASNYLTVQNVTLYNNYIGIMKYSGSNHVLKNIISVQNTSSDFNINGGSWGTASNNLSSDATAPGAGSLTSQTLSQVAFVSTASGIEDFHILPASVAKDAGTSLASTFTTDIDAGQVRPYNSTWDIGTDEWFPSGPIYNSPGTYTSATLDSTTQNIISATLTKTDSVGTGTIAYELSNNGGTTYASVTPGSAYTFATTGSNLKVRATFTSVDLISTPSLDDVTISYTYYPASQTLTSSAYNSTDSANIIGSLAWAEDQSLPTGTGITTSLRAASSSAGLTSASWNDFTNATTNCAKSSSTVTCPLSAIPAGLKDGTNDQWLQYKVTLTSTGTNTPTFSDTTIQYVVNAPPNFDTSFNTTGVTASQNSDGTVTIQYQIRDPDTTTGTVTPNAITPSFEYSTNGGTSYSSITSTYLASTDLQNKTVSESSYNLYTATWSPKAQLGSSTYVTNAKIRVTINDNEAANNTQNAATANFTLDTTNPVPGSPSLSVNPNSQTPTISTLTISATDNSSMQMKVGLASDLSDASWENYSVTKTITLQTDPDTVYIQFKDSYANTSSIVSATTPETTTAMMIQDTSNLKLTPPEYRLFAAWKVIQTPNPGFKQYNVLRSQDNTTFIQIATITDINTNYYGDSSVTFNQTYYYKVSSQDNNNNISFFSQTIQAKPDGIQNLGEGGGGTDGLPPTISNVTSSNIQTTQATINWTTDELSNSTVGYSTDTSFGTESGVASYVTSHQVTLTNLTPNTTYIFQVKSTDPTGNQSTSTNPTLYTFTTSSGPKITNVTTEDIANTTAKIIWYTDIDSNSYVVYSTNSNLTSSTQTGTASLTGANSPSFYHQVTLINLTQGTNYYYYVKSTDNQGNIAINNNGLNYYTFKTTQDSTSPTISDITVSTTTPDTSIITWTTNEPSTSQIEYGKTTSYGLTTTQDIDLALTHIVSITSLTPNTTYNFKVKSKDSSGNESISTNQTFTTLKENQIKQDQIAPTISSINVGSITSNSATVIFNSSESCLGSVQYGTTTSYGEIKGETTSTTTHSIKLGDLSSSTTYNFKVTCRDTSDNVGQSENQTFTTLAPTATGEGGKSETEKRVENLLNEKFSNEDIQNAIKKLSSPPTITGTGPEVIDIRSNSAKIKWTTDKKASSLVIYSSDSAQELNTKNTGVNVEGKEDDQSLTHEVTLANLIPGTLYYFKAKSQDIYGNITTSQTKSFTTLIIPLISDVTISDITLTSAIITWHTSVITTGYLEYGKDTNYGSKKEHEDPTTKGTTHAIPLTNLDPTTIYHFRIKGVSSTDNSLISSEDYTFNTQSLPEISKETIKKITDNSAKITFQTNIPTDTQIFYRPLKSPQPPMQQRGRSDLTRDHEIEISDLEFGTDYDIQIKAKDAFDNTAQKQLPTFTTGIDITPPTITLLRTENALIPGKKDKVQTIISWKTDEPSTTQITYQEGIDLKRTELKEKTPEDKSLNKDHVVVLTTLKPGTVYQLKAISQDNQQNQTISNNQTMLTPKQQESVFQVIMKNLEDVFGWVKKIR